MNSQIPLSPLDNLQIAKPCHADWEKMTGDDKARFCQSCHKNVYNISMMSRSEAESLILAKEGKLCVRYSQRADGTIITQDCPVGMAKVKTQALRPLRWMMASVAALLTAVASSFGAEAPKQCTPVKMGEPAPHAPVLMGKPVTHVMGAVPAPPPPPVTGNIKPAPTPAVKKTVAPKPVKNAAKKPTPKVVKPAKNR